MKVFVTGATGYIGSGVAETFRRAGHEVWGLILDAQSVPLLARQEIHPVIGDLREPGSYRRVAEACDALIHCAADYQHDWAASDRQTIETMIAASRKGRQPKTVVFTSGSWVYGNTHGQPVTETAALSPVQIGAHRPAVEQMLLQAQNVRGLVIRPANVYGKREGMLNEWLSAASHGQPIVVAGDGNNHWPMVHVDDLAVGYRLAVESGLGGEIFHFADQAAPPVRELVTAIVQVTGFQGEIRYLPADSAAQTMGANAEVMALDLRLDSSKAARMLGWHRRHSGFVDEAETYFESWVAWRGAASRSTARSAEDPTLAIPKPPQWLEKCRNVATGHSSRMVQGDA